LKIGSKPLVANLQPTPAVHPDSLTVAETSQENHPTLAFLIQWMGLWLSEKLKLSVSSIDQSQSFANYGLDSVMAVELAQDLETLLNKPVEPMIIWNYTTPESLANYLVYEQSIKPTQVHHPDLSKELTNFAEPFTRTRNESSQSLNETEVAILLAEELTKDKPENGE
jgi:acyl carrier protein